MIDDGQTFSRVLTIMNYYKINLKNANFSQTIDFNTMLTTNNLRYHCILPFSIDLCIEEAKKILVVFRSFKDIVMPCSFFFLV